MVPAFDEVIHPANRLRICSVLAAASEVEFATLRDTLAISDSALSKHLKVLAEAGYVRLSKPTGNGRVRTWVTLTAPGLQAFTAHVAELRRLTAGTGAVARTRSCTG